MESTLSMGNLLGILFTLFAIMIIILGGINYYYNDLTYHTSDD